MNAFFDPIPMRAIILEGLTVLTVTFVVLMLIIKYFQRKREPAFTLALAFAFWVIGAASVFIGAIIENIYKPVLESRYSTIGINIGYAFSAVSNFLIVLFVSQIFSQAPVFRRTQKLIPLIVAILNGITIGLVIDNLVSNWILPEYPIGQTVYHLILTIFSFTLLWLFALNARRLSTFHWEKGGFTFIIFSAITGIFIYLSFALDIVVQEIWPIFNEGYTFFNSLGWVFAIMMCILAYFGYVMPNYLRKLYKEEVPK